ncbi:MAG: hypothetical protein KA186_10745 [Flavobacteriales bacterium]|nr:hypothetical protein [Flavobacteriales bacterium]
MNFVVVENIRNHGTWDSVKGFGHGLLKLLLGVVLVPIFLLSRIVDLFKKRNNPTCTDIWKTLYEADGFKLEIWDIDENELPTDLDYPEEPNDIYAQYLRSTPLIKGLDGLYFSAIHLRVKDGFYFFTFNEQGMGMSLWLLRTTEQEFLKVRDVTSNWWSISQLENGVLLKAKESKRDVELRIAPMA